MTTRIRVWGGYRTLAADKCGAGSSDNSVRALPDTHVDHDVFSVYLFPDLLFGFIYIVMDAFWG